MTHHEAHAHPAVGATTHTHHDETTHADALDLDAQVVGHLDDLTAWVEHFLPRAPRTVVDLGAGGGTGSFALALRFPEAQVVAVDASPEMLAHLSSAATARGLDSRVSTLEADLDTQWPDVADIDLAWAASSLHHVQRPAQVLADVRQALAPDGVVVVVEMDGLPRFLPADVGVGLPGLEDRCHDAMARAGWNAHPDWAPYLEAAGLAVLEQRTFTYHLDPAPAAAYRYAQVVLTNVRSGLADLLTPGDLRALDHLLDADAPMSLLRRRDLVVRSARTVWAARRA